MKTKSSKLILKNTSLKLNEVSNFIKDFSQTIYLTYLDQVQYMNHLKTLELVKK